MRNKKLQIAQFLIRRVIFPLYVAPVAAFARLAGQNIYGGIGIGGGHVGLRYIPPLGVNYRKSQFVHQLPEAEYTVLFAYLSDFCVARLFFTRHL